MGFKVLRNTNPSHEAGATKKKSSAAGESLGEDGKSSSKEGFSHPDLGKP